MKIGTRLLFVGTIKEIENGNNWLVLFESADNKAFVWLDPKALSKQSKRRKPRGNK